MAVAGATARAAVLPKHYPGGASGPTVVEPLAGPLSLSTFKLLGTSPTLSCTSPLELMGTWHRGALIYASCVDTAGRTARWTAHVLAPDNYRSDVGRPVVEPWSHYPKAIDGSPLPMGNGSVLNNYDRGHLVPRGDFAGSTGRATSTFHVVNRAPQAATFNRYGWRCAETLLRAFARDRGKTLLVVTGTTAGKHHAAEQHGKSISIPARFWKVAFDPASGTHLVLSGKNASLNDRPAPTCSTTATGEPLATIRSAVTAGLACTNRKGASLVGEFRTWLLGTTPASAAAIDRAMSQRCVARELVCPGRVDLTVHLERLGNRSGPLYFRIFPESRLCSSSCEVSVGRNASTIPLFGGPGMLPPVGKKTRGPVVAAFQDAALRCQGGGKSTKTFGDCMSRIESYFTRPGRTEPDFAKNVTAAVPIGTTRMRCSEP